VTASRSHAMLKPMSPSPASSVRRASDWFCARSPALVLAAFIGGGASGGAATPLSTVYVNKYYEVRDHDAPTKYVFNSSTRIARATGSLSAKLRLQRLRVYAGWNLSSLAVTAADARTQLSAAGSPPALERFINGSRRPAISSRWRLGRPCRQARCSG